MQSNCVLYWVDQALVTVGKWALLAAGEKEINRERQRLDSPLSCAVTILGQVLKETRLTSCVYSCFPHEICRSWRPRVLVYVYLYVYLRGQLQWFNTTGGWRGCLFQCSDITSVALEKQKGISTKWITLKLTSFKLMRVKSVIVTTYLLLTHRHIAKIHNS